MKKVIEAIITSTFDCPFCPTWAATVTVEDDQQEIEEGVIHDLPHCNKFNTMSGVAFLGAARK